MEPLSAYEIQELMGAMAQGDSGIPIGSMWANEATPQIFLLLHHANRMTNDGPERNLVFQALPSGEAWVHPKEEFLHNNWVNIGFIWDRGIDV